MQNCFDLILVSPDALQAEQYRKWQNFDMEKEG